MDGQAENPRQPQGQDPHLIVDGREATFKTNPGQQRSHKRHRRTEPDEHSAGALPGLQSVRRHQRRRHRPQPMHEQGERHSEVGLAYRLVGPETEPITARPPLGHRPREQRRARQPRSPDRAPQRQRIGPGPQDSKQSPRRRREQAQGPQAHQEIRRRQCPTERHLSPHRHRGRNPQHGQAMPQTRRADGPAYPPRSERPRPQTRHGQQTQQRQSHHAPAHPPHPVPTLDMGHPDVGGEEVERREVEVAGPAGLVSGDGRVICRQRLPPRLLGLGRAGVEPFVVPQKQHPIGLQRLKHVDLVVEGLGQKVILPRIEERPTIHLRQGCPHPLGRRHRPLPLRDRLINPPARDDIDRRQRRGIARHDVPLEDPHHGRRLEAEGENLLLGVRPQIEPVQHRRPRRLQHRPDRGHRRRIRGPRPPDPVAVDRLQIGVGIPRELRGRIDIQVIEPPGPGLQIQRHRPGAPRPTVLGPEPQTVQVLVSRAELPQRRLVPGPKVVGDRAERLELPPPLHLHQPPLLPHLQRGVQRQI